MPAKAGTTNGLRAKFTPFFHVPRKINIVFPVILRRITLSSRQRGYTIKISVTYVLVADVQLYEHLERCRFFKYSRFTAAFSVDLLPERLRR